MSTLVTVAYVYVNLSVLWLTYYPKIVLLGDNLEVVLNGTYREGMLLLKSGMRMTHVAVHIREICFPVHFFFIQKRIGVRHEGKNILQYYLGVGSLYLVLSSGPGFCYVFLDLKEDLEDITVCGA